jgi:hypothetical protein
LVDFISLAEQKRFFRTDYRIFTTRLLVRIVNEKDAHDDPRVGWDSQSLTGDN